MRAFLKIFGVFVLLLVLICIGLFLSLGYFLSPQDKLEDSHAIVAISGGDTKARTEEAVKLYKDGRAPYIIFSGAAQDPNSPSNALAMKRLAMEMGVPSEDILLEEGAANTVQNAYEVKKILDAHQMTKIILVTSPYHQRRASLVFHAELGKEVTILNHSAIDQNWRRSRWWDNRKSLFLTLSESQKTLYVLIFGDRAGLAL